MSANREFDSATVCTHPVGRLVVSVDLEPADNVSHTGVVRGRHEVGERVFALVDRLRLPATWAVAEPANSTIVERIAATDVQHEIALLGEPYWVGQLAGRATFQRELSRRLAAAAANGLTVTSLAPRGVLVDDHLDLLLKHQITAVRGVVDAAAISRRPAKPHPLHFGLWEAPGSLRLPGCSRYSPGGGRGLHARRTLSAVADRAEFFHLVVDVTLLAARGRFAERTLANVLKFASRLHSEGEIHVATLGDTVAELASATIGAPQRSILRPTG